MEGAHIYLIFCLLRSALSTCEVDIPDTPTLQMKKLSPRGRTETHKTTRLLENPIPLGFLFIGKL